MPVNVSPPQAPTIKQRETLNRNEGPCAENQLVINSPKAGKEASGTPVLAESISGPLQATQLGHTPNTGGISAKKGDFFGKFLNNSKLRAFK